jgi:glycosyltransferase involved in cell wall biosynthesis
MENKKQKTVLYIGGFELPDKNAAAQRVIANAKILRALGYDVVFVGIDKTIKSNELVLNTKKEFEGFTYFSIKYPQSILDWINYLVSIKYLTNLKDLNFTHIIAYNYPSLGLLRLKNFCKKGGIILIADCTEWYEVQGGIIHKLIKGADVYLRMHIIQPKLDGLIVISDYLFKFYGDKIKNLILLPPLVDISMNKWNFEDNREDNDKITLVYAGSPGIGGKDRLDKIINALVEIRKKIMIPFVFNILGLTKEEYLKLFQGAYLPENSEEFIFFKGRVSHTEVLNEVNKAEYVVFIRNVNLTNMAGFPTKFVEAISCGTPVLSNSTSNIEEYLINGKTGFLLNTKTSEETEKSLSDALTLNKDEIMEMKRYCWSTEMFHYKKYLNSFQSFLNGVSEK